MRREYLAKLKLGLILGIAFILRFLFLSWMPTLNGDAAWEALRSFETVYQGKLILTGIKSVDGALLEYLFAMCYKLFGINVISIRLPFALMNVLTVLLVYLFIKRLYDETAGLICSLMMSVYPWFAIYLRIAWHPSAMPFFTMLVLYLLCLNRSTAYFFAGVVIGLKCYDYQPIICLPAVLLILYLIYHRKANISLHSLMLLLVGAIIGYTPKILWYLLYGTSWETRPLDTLPSIISETIVCIPYFLRILDGSIIFLRVTGNIAFPVIPLNSIILIGSIYILVKNKEKINRPLVISLPLFFGLILIAQNYTSIRYFACMLVAASLISGLGVYLLFKTHRKLGAGVLKLFVVVNLFYIISNFFVEFSRTGGRLAIFRAGNFLECSHASVRTDVLYEALDKSVPVLIAPNPIIRLPLKFYDLNRQHFKFDNFIKPDYEEFYYIYYASGYPPGEAIDPNRFPAYDVIREHPELKNFSIYRLKKRAVTKKWGLVPR